MGDTFPVDSVVDYVQRVGKHFLPAELLDVLDKERAAGPAPELARFLDVVLDKHDGRYDYVSYLALDLLPLPGRGMTVAAARRRADELVLALVEDAIAFERAPRPNQLPEDRPGPEVVAKRVHLAGRALAAARRRSAPLVDPAVRRSMLPVATLHDEYLFIRVLQAFETTFALLAVLLDATVSTVATDADAAAGHLATATTALQETAPLFSLLATMRVAAFRTFRAHTEGASAIQSRNYKKVESLCRRPDQDRLDSPAYRSVPDLPPAPTTVDEAVTAAGRPPVVVAAMDDFAAALSRWRHTHYRLAMRMLGAGPGTGYTEGTPYLERVRTIPVF
jgi:hypothetical protein